MSVNVNPHLFVSSEKLKEMAEKQSQSSAAELGLSQCELPTSGFPAQAS